MFRRSLFGLNLNRKLTYQTKNFLNASNDSVIKQKQQKNRKSFQISSFNSKTLLLSRSMMIPLSIEHKRNFYVSFENVQQAIGIMAGLSGIAGAIFAWKSTRNRELVANYVHSIGNLLKKPFVPPAQPKFGPLFQRKRWKKQFVEMINTDCYQLYYGPSQVGKSLAIASFLEGRTGVVSFSLREAAGEVRLRFAKATEYFGDKKVEPKEIPPVGTIFETFADACKKYFQEKSEKVVVVIEDVNECMNEEETDFQPDLRTLCGYMLELYNAGYISVIYTMSDLHHVALMKSISGHSRLNVTRVPKFPLLDMVELLSEMCVKLPQSKGMLHDGTQYKWSFMEEDKKGAKAIPDGYSRLFSQDQASYLAFRLNTHMGDISSALESIIVNHTPFKEAVDSIVDQYVSPLRETLRGKPSVLEKIDRNAFIVISFHLLDSLSQNKTPSERADWSHTYLNSPLKDLVKVTQVMATIDRLVELKFLTNVDDTEIEFHANLVKYAFDIVRQDALMQHEYGNAVNELKKMKVLEENLKPTTS